MDCLIHLTAALCLLQPGQLTVRADASAQVGGDVRYFDHGVNYGGALVGHVAVEMPLATYRGFTLTGGFHHYSLMNTDRDRGEERLAVGFVYLPFGGVR